MTRDLLAGIDSSTQSTTIVLRRRSDGAVVGEARAPHPPTTPPRSEQDPRDWWAAFETAAAQLGKDAQRVAAISVGGQGHGLVILDDADRPLCPAKLWNDTEANPDAQALRKAIAPATWAERTGCVPGPAHTVSKVAFTRRVRPEALEAAARLMLPSDYMVYRLCSENVTERGVASGTAYFDSVADAHAPDLLELAAGRDVSGALPRVIGSHEAAGKVRSGPFAGAVVGAGSGDNMTAALCLGLQPGDSVISLGTSATVYAVCETPVRDPTGAIDGYADATGRYLPMVTTLNAAKVTDTVRRLISVDIATFDALALSPALSGAPVLLPYLDGERTPDLPDARGILFGLTTDLSPEGLARASVDGVLCGLLAGRDQLEAQGLELGGRLILTGGAARSKAYRQRLADLSGLPVWVSEATETAASGACVQAEVALSGKPMDEVLAAFAPRATIVAEPRHGEEAAAGEVRAAYAALADFASEHRATLFSSVAKPDAVLSAPPNPTWTHP